MHVTDMGRVFVKQGLPMGSGRWAESLRGGQGPLPTGWVIAQRCGKQGISRAKGSTWTTARRWEGRSLSPRDHRAGSPPQGKGAVWAGLSDPTDPRFPPPQQGFRTKNHLQFLLRGSQGEPVSKGLICL